MLSEYEKIKGDLDGLEQEDEWKFIWRSKVKWAKDGLNKDRPLRNTDLRLMIRDKSPDNIASPNVNMGTVQRQMHPEIIQIIGKQKETK